jgi:hypothetical protein
MLESSAGQILDLNLALNYGEAQSAESSKDFIHKWAFV